MDSMVIPLAFESGAEARNDAYTLILMYCVRLCKFTRAAL